MPKDISARGKSPTAPKKKERKTLRERIEEQKMKEDGMPPKPEKSKKVN